MKILKHGAAHKLMLFVEQQPAGVEDISLHLLPLVAENVHQAIATSMIPALLEGGLIFVDEKEEYALTSVGEGTLKRLAEVERAKPTEKVKARLPPISGGTYDGAELKSRVQRSGAYDFLAHPSLINGVRVPLKGQNEAV